MKKTIEIIAWLILIALLAVSLHLASHRQYRTEIVSDTIVIHDTVTRTMPVPTAQTAIDEIRVTLPLALPYYADTLCSAPLGGGQVGASDSAEVLIPITQNHYKDSLYEAWVSGYLPRLDSIRLYPTTNYITHTITKTEYTKRKKFSLGVGIGYGYNGSQFTPYIGVHIGYKLFEW